MHGRPRNYQDKLKDPKVAEAYRRKVEAIKAGTTLVLRCAAAGRHDAAALTAADRLLRVVPELYTVWNFRREALLAGALREALEAVEEKEEDEVRSGGGGDADAADAADAKRRRLDAVVVRGEAAVSAELELSQACLQENPKSYCTWHHRRWALDQGVVLRGGLRTTDHRREGAGDEEGEGEGKGEAGGGSSARALLERELQLVARALEADDRNFHAWAHRRWVARRLGVSAARELAFAGAKVAADFSNYSAWHQRSLLLAEAVAEEEREREEQERQERQEQQRRQEQGQEGRGEDGRGASPAVATLDEVLARGTGRAAAAAAAGGDAAAAEASLSAGPPLPPTPPTLLPPDVLDAEFDVVHSAFATDSRDQSPWVYYAWLVGQALARLRAARVALRREEEEEEDKARGGGGGLALALARAREADARAEAADRLARERVRLEEEHLADDPDARWPLLTVARLKEAQARLGLFLPPVGAGAGAGADDDGEEASRQRLLGEARAAYERLAEIDPMRAGYYRDAAAGHASVAIGGEW